MKEAETILGLLRESRRSETAATTGLPIANRQSAIVNELIPATTDSPTRLPLQYHGPWRA